MEVGKWRGKRRGDGGTGDMEKEREAEKEGRKGQNRERNGGRKGTGRVGKGEVEGGACGGERRRGWEEGSSERRGE